LIFSYLRAVRAVRAAVVARADIELRSAQAAVAAQPKARKLFYWALTTQSLWVLAGLLVPILALTVALVETPCSIRLHLQVVAAALVGDRETLILELLAVAAAAELRILLATQEAAEQELQTRAMLAEQHKVQAAIMVQAAAAVRALLDKQLVVAQAAGLLVVMAGLVLLLQ
jgi:hypothetical protein